MDTLAPKKKACSMTSLLLALLALLALLSPLLATGCVQEHDTCNKACEYLGRCSLPSSSHLAKLREAACGPGVDACRDSASHAVDTEEGQGRCVINALDRLALIHTPDDAETWDYVEDEDFCKGVELVLSGQVSKEHQEPFKHACEGGSSNGLTDNCTWIYDQLTGVCRLTLPSKS
jgi:hypothetical protein